MRQGPRNPTARFALALPRELWRARSAAHGRWSGGPACCPAQRLPQEARPPCTLTAGSVPSDASMLRAPSPEDSRTRGRRATAAASSLVPSKHWPGRGSLSRHRALRCPATRAAAPPAGLSPSRPPPHTARHCALPRAGLPPGCTVTCLQAPLDTPPGPALHVPSPARRPPRSRPAPRPASRSPAVLASFPVPCAWRGGLPSRGRVAAAALQVARRSSPCSPRLHLLLPVHSLGPRVSGIG